MAGRHEWDGTISARDFLEASRTFCQRWVEVNPNLPPWVWISQPTISGSSDGLGYLSLENVCLQRSIEELAELECCSSNEEPDADSATLVQNPCSGIHFYDYHILYSFSYNVPVLYFRGYQWDGQPLLLEEIKVDFPPSSRSILTESRWTFLTTEDHPFLHRPWHMLHPCGTRDWMKLLFSGSSHPSDNHRTMVVNQYIPSWLSVISQVVGLKLPLGMHSAANVSPLTGETIKNH